MQKSILDFTDYRAFLNAHYYDRKRQNKNFSYGVWARSLGLKNNTSLLKILNGSRNAGPAIQEQLIKYFDFDERERIYFSDLVQLAKIKPDSPLHGALIERLAVRHSSSRFQLLSADQFAILSDWWGYAIRQLTKISGFQASAIWIAKHLRYGVSPKQVTAAVDRMIDQGLLNGNLGQSLTSTSFPVRTTTDISSEAIKRFHEASFENCKKSVREVPLNEREHSAYICAFKMADLAQAKDFLSSIVDQFEARFGKNPSPDSVYQLQIAFIPLSKENSKVRKVENEK